MAIRKDIDDILNNLKSGGKPSAPAEKKVPASATQRTRKIDNMSVDDLLNVLEKPKLSEQPEAVKPKQEISVPKEEEVPVIVSSVMHTESSTHNTKVFTASEMSEMQTMASAEASKSAVKPEQPAPKKRKIVISHELPDYEAIRQQELEKDRRAAEEKARREAEEKARREAEEKARREAEEQAQREAEEKARREAEEKARREAEEKARREAEEKARREAEEQARREAEEKARREAEEQARREAEEKARREAEEQARREAEEKARREAEEQARREAEEQAQKEAEEKPEIKVIKETDALANIEDNVPQAELSEVSVLSYDDEDEEDGIQAETKTQAEAKTEKKGLFSKIKNIFSGDDIMADDFDETSEEIENGQKAALAEASAKLAESVDGLEENPAEERSATELIDEAIASLKNEEEYSVQIEEVTDEPAEEEESSDSVSQMLSNIRNSAEAAIADIDKKSEKSDSDEISRFEAPEEDEETEAEKPRKSRFGSIFRNILDEDPDEIVSERSEKAEDGDETPKKKNGKKTLYTVLGVIFSVFAVIGVVAVIIKGAGLMKSFTSGEVKKDGFTEMIYPAVIMDIESFNSPAELTSEQVITATLWSIIMDNEKASKYESSFGDTVSIPDIDVEKYAVELFGENLPAFTHATVGSVESRFYYSDGAYNVKLRPIIFTYSPEIKSIVKSGSEYTLTVDYIDELPTWMEKTVAKTVEFGLTQNEDGTFCIKSMKILSVKASN